MVWLTPHAQEVEEIGEVGNGVARADGKTAAKANKSVAARIVKKVESV